ncbi:MAG: MMPL family transporter [Pseudomonadales bacterium]|nr:MMPL family transporter [Pseudomonadales bacterium]
MTNGWTSFIINARWAVIASVLTLVAIAGYGIQFVVLKADFREYFPDNAPYVTDFDRMEETYINSDMILMVIAPTEGDTFTRKTLSIIEEMTNQAWTLPYAARVDSITNFQHTTAIEDELNVAPLVEDPQSYSDAKLNQIREIALNDIQMVDRLISKNGKVSNLMITVNLPGQELSETEDIALAVRALAEKYRLQDPSLEIYITGMVMGNYATVEITKADAVSLIPFMGLIIVLSLALLLRSIGGTIATVVVIALTVISAVGLLGWAGSSFSGPSSCAPVVILTIAVADCVHILVSFFFSLRDGLSREDAIKASLQINIMPIFLTSLTTAIGFLSMNFSEVPPFVVLGNVVAAGVIIAFLLSITLLPALMAIIPFKTPAKNRTSMNLKIMESLSSFVIKNRKPLFWVLTCTSILLIVAIPKNEINDEFVGFFAEHTEFKSSTDFATENISSIVTIEYALKSPYKGGVNDIRFLNALQDFDTWLKQQPEVDQVMSLVDVMKQLSKSMHNNEEDWYKLPESRELAAQYLLMYELSLPYGLDLTNQISFDKKETRLVLTLKELSSKEMLALEAKLNQWLDLNLPNIEYYKSSPMLLFANLGIVNAYSMLAGSAIALLIISVIIMFALRSLKLGFVSIISNMVPAGLAFGFWGITVGQVNIAVSIAIGMTLGIVVDNTVHFLSKYLHARKHLGGKSEVAVAYAFSHVGTALVVCNIVLIAGFMVLAQSDFRLNTSMGYFTSLTFIMALVVDFLLLPPVLMMIDKADLAPANKSGEKPVISDSENNTDYLDRAAG